MIRPLLSAGAGIRLLGLVLGLTAATLRPALAAGPDADPALQPNGSFEMDADGDGWPDSWASLKEARWEQEGTNHFLRLTAPEPGRMVRLFQPVVLPADVKAIRLSWRQRVSGLKLGKEAWFDARIILNFKDAVGGKQVPPSPPAPYARENSQGWQARSIRFLVPQGAKVLEFMPALFEVEAGTLDLDDIVLTATDPAPLEAALQKAAAEAKAAQVAPEPAQPAQWPQPLHVKGNQVLNRDGRPVWLQGVNVVSLEWTPQGENVVRSARVALEEWKANSIRLALKEDYWFGKAGGAHGGEAYRALVEACINLVANRGAYVVLDLHQYRAPRRTYVDFWKAVATRYKNHPAVLFDLLNEPHDTTWQVWRDGGFVPDKQAPADEDAFLSAEEKALNAKGFHAVGMQALVDAVRGTGASNIVVVGGLDWAYDLSGIAKGFALNDRGGNGIIYSTHIYPWKRDWQNKVLVLADKHPILVGEVGANTRKMTFIPAEHQEDAATWVPRVLGLIQKHKLHWTGWSFHPGAAPVMITGWDYTPTPEWGALAKRALAGEQFPPQELR